MDFLNSQHLTPHDAFIHPFREAGTFTYSARVSDFGNSKEGVIVVQAAKAAIGKGEQHDIVLHWDTAACVFVPRDEDMKKVIKQNDFIVFHFDQAEPGQPTCFILGHDGDKVEFDSRHLRSHQVFSHFFLAPGDYSYRLGHEVHRVSVTGHQQFPVEEHEKRAQEAVVIMVAGDNPSVKHAKIVAGQTVIWAIEKGENVSIETFAFEHPKPKENEQYPYRKKG